MIGVVVPLNAVLFPRRTDYETTHVSRTNPASCVEIVDFLPFSAVLLYD